MTKFQLRIEDNIIEKIGKDSKNKSEFIRQAINEKLENKKAEKSKNSKLNSHFDEIESRLIHTEKMFALLSQGKRI